MKAFYYEFFHIPKQGKLRERVLMSHVALTAVLIIVYLLAISGSAYAFHTWATRVDSILTAAHFEVEIEIAGPEGNEIELEEQRDGMLLAVLEEPGLYEVVLEPGGTAETGFATMELDGNEYITAQLGVSMEDEDEYRDELRFSIQVYEFEPVEVRFMSHWGTSTAYVTYILDDIDGELYLVGDEYIEVGDPAALLIQAEAEETSDEYIEEFEEAEYSDEYEE